MTAPMVKLNNGQLMPALGLGTYLKTSYFPDVEFDCYKSTKFALENGYRHIDTATLYENEEDIGRAINDVIKEGTLKREEIFVTTKLWNIHHDPIHVEKACRKSLRNLNLEYVDLYLLHTPMGYEYRENEELLPKDSAGNLVYSDVDYLDTWKEMEKLIGLGIVKSIGLSNFNSQQIQRILDNGCIKPVTNQVECNATLNQKKLIKFCKERDIVLTAYSPLTRPHYYAKDQSLPKPAMLDDHVNEIAKKYGKTGAQIVLRYLFQNGTVPVPKSANEKRIVENINIFDFELNADEMTYMDSFNTGRRTIPYGACKDHKYYMFNIEF